MTLMNFLQGSESRHSPISSRRISRSPRPIYDPQADNVTDTCKSEDNPLLNGVYIWTETTSAGHVFVSVHENNNIFLYTYGRYGRTDKVPSLGMGF